MIISIHLTHKKKKKEKERNVQTTIPLPRSQEKVHWYIYAIIAIDKVSRRALGTKIEI